MKLLLAVLTLAVGSQARVYPASQSFVGTVEVPHLQYGLPQVPVAGVPYVSVHKEPIPATTFSYGYSIEQSHPTPGLQVYHTPVSAHAPVVVHEEPIHTTSISHEYTIEQSHPAPTQQIHLYQTPALTYNVPKVHEVVVPQVTYGVPAPEVVVEKAIETAPVVPRVTYGLPL